MKIKLINERNQGISFIDQILRNRGVEKNAEEFFSVGWECVNNPHNLDNIDIAADKLIEHINKNSKIAVLVDVDVDGFTSAALLINYINMQKELGDEWKDYSGEIVPVFHKSKTHGLDDREMMTRIRDEIKPDLFVIPDASGTDYQYQALTDLGIDLLVLDHHDTRYYGDNEKVIVVNNQHSKKYTNKNLSGVGVVWQFCRVLDEKLTLVCADQFLDLVAVGNIGDVMDMRSDETRFLCRLGLMRENIRSQFLNYVQFTDYTLRDKEMNTETVGFSIAPKFNAVCRIGDDTEKGFLFDSLLDSKALMKVPNGKRGHTGEEVALVEEACRLADNTRTRQNNRRDKLMELIDNVISDEGLQGNQVIILAFDDFKEEYRALGGLVCNQLIEIYDRPVIITFRNEDGYYSGSFRCPDRVPAYNNFKDQLEESGLCRYVAGHQYAAGVGINPENVDKLVDYFNEKYEGLDTDIYQKVDFIIDADDPELPDLICELAQYSSAWGQNLEKPVIAIRGVKLAKSNMLLCGAKKTTLKVSCLNFSLINFKSGQTEYDSLKLPYNGVEQYYSATVIGYDPAINTYMGSSTPQLQFRDYILDSVKYDF